MKRGTCVLAIGLCTATLALVPANRQAVDAATVSACHENVNWTFSPALTSTFQSSGSVTYQWSHLCAIVSTGGGSGLFPDSGSVTFSYMGSCTSASLSGPGISGLLLGGTVAVFTAPGEKVFVLTPLNPCSDSGPTPSTGVELNP